MKTSTEKPIGTKVFAISKGWKKTNFNGARLMTGKITGCQNIGGKVHPVIEVNKKELGAETNYIFYDLETALKKLKGE